jgi:DNA-binding CsgD family transcriptional regulator
MASEIIGRDDEVERLRTFLDAPALEGPRALVLEGEAGIGKSTIWLEGVELAQERRFRVLSVRPAEAEQELDFAGLGDLFEGCIDEVLPTLAPPRRRALEVSLLVAEAHDPIDSRTLGVAVRDAVETLATAEPLLVAVDDVQWLDRATADALAFAVRRTTVALHLMVAHRVVSGVEPSSLERALHEREAKLLAVGPLSVGALQTLIRDRLERVLPRPMLLRIHDTSGGNPFYALELARALPHDLDPSRPLPVPETLEELVRARIEALPEPSRRALVLLSALGEADAATLRKTGVEDAIEAALARGIVERTADRLRFTHPLLASTVYQSADGRTRRSCHGVLAEIVGDRLESARHLALSRQEPDAGLAAVVEEAAELASARGATGAAVVLRRHTLRLTPPDAVADVHRRTIGLVRAQNAAGAPVTVSEAMVRDLLARSAPGAQRAEAFLLAADLSPDIPTTIAFRRQALDEARDDPRLQGYLHHLLAWDVRFVDGLEAAERHAQACIAIADRLEDDAMRGAGLIVLSAIRLHRARPDALCLGEQGHELARAGADPEELAWDTLAFSSSLIWSFHLGRARTLLERLDREWGARDEMVASGTLFRLAYIELLAGRLDRAADLAERVEAINDAYGRAEPGMAWLVAEIAAWRGDLERARSLVERALESPDMIQWSVPPLETVLGRIALWSGSPSLASEHFSRAEDARAVGSLEPSLARWRADYAEALVQLGRVADAVSLLDSWEGEAARLERGVVLAQVTRCRGLVAAARGEVGAAMALLERAVDDHAAVGDPLGRGRALLALGVVRRRARRRAGARDAIEEAVAIFDGCGARGWADRSRSELGRIGGRTREEGLTPAERRVAALVAEGRTNREVATALVLGERTVETHLTHIYAKLGVRSRTELAREYEPAS